MSRSPELVGDAPMTTWRNKGRKTMPPNMPRPMMNPVAEVMAKVRSRNSRSGRIGSAARRSWRRNRPSSVTATIDSPMIIGESQAILGASPHHDQEERGDSTDEETGSQVVDRVMRRAGRAG